MATPLSWLRLFHSWALRGCDRFVHPAFRTQSTTGKDENARAVMKAFLDKKSWSTLSNYRRPCLYKRNEDLDRYLNLLRKAGMPE